MPLRRRAALRAAILAFLTCALLIPVIPSAACASGHINLFLGGFPADANPNGQPFYAVAEDQLSTSFRVVRRSDDCKFIPAATDYSAADGTARNGSDFHLPAGRTPPMDDPNHSSGNPPYRDIPVEVTNDVIAEAGLEHAQIRLSNPSPDATLAHPSAAPLYFIDDDGLGSRVLLLPSYTQSETHTEVLIPVFRAGPAAGAATVSYAITPGGPAPAQADDFGGSSSGTVTFGSATDRVEVIRFSITNDRQPEPPETLQISLTGPTGASIEQATMTFTIQDNEEAGRPKSRLHHPRHRKTYPADSYRIREIHLFTEDPGGSGVVGAQLAVRRTSPNGRCAWLRGQRFRPGKCSRGTWNRMDVYEPGYFYYYRLRRPLAPSVGGGVESYTAYARATDGAGNVERVRKGRTRNTFEISRKR